MWTRSAPRKMQRPPTAPEKIQPEEKGKSGRLSASSCVILADRFPREREFYPGAAEHPRHERIAVRAGPRQVALAEGIGLRRALQRLDQPERVLAEPLRHHPRRPAADAVVGPLEVAVQVAEARAARVLRLPDLPALAGAFAVEGHEPVMLGDGADERQRRAAKLDPHLRGDRPERPALVLDPLRERAAKVRERGVGDDAVHPEIR